jgi:hypothetical protein
MGGWRKAKKEWGIYVIIAILKLFRVPGAT